MRKILFPALFGLAVAAGGAAHADDITVTRSPASAPVLGTVIRGSTATTYSISTSGSVTRTSGNAIRLSNASVTAPTISIECDGRDECKKRGIRVTIRPTGGWGDAAIVRLRRGPVSGYSTSVPSVNEGATLVFDLPALGDGRRVSFPIGMDVQLDAGAQGLIHLFTYTVTADYR